MPANPDPKSDLPQRRLHRLPLAIYSKTEFEFFFTVCARHQGAPFLNAALAKEVIDSLLWTRNQYHWLLYCYCLMPDHLHFVCRLTEEQTRIINAGARGVQVESVLDHLARFKSFTTNKSWKLGFTGPLWQKSCFDRVFDLAKPVEEVIEYSLENPVRKQLVVDWRDWPYSRIVDPWWE
jgi:REP element-mobilizing transposase RayT